MKWNETKSTFCNSDIWLALHQAFNSAQDQSINYHLLDKITPQP